MNIAEEFPRTPGNESHPGCPPGRPRRIHKLMTSERRHASEDGIVEEISVYIFGLEAKIATLREALLKAKDKINARCLYTYQEKQVSGFIDEALEATKEKPLTNQVKENLEEECDVCGGIKNPTDDLICAKCGRFIKGGQ